MNCISSFVILISVVAAASPSALCDVKTDVNAMDAFGQTELIRAARSGDLKTVHELVTKKADVNLCDARGDTALMKAATNCLQRVSQELISADANVNLTNHEGRTALIYAVRSGCVRLVEELSKARGIDVNVEDDSHKTALDYALEEAHPDGGPFNDIANALRAAGGRRSMR